MECLRCGAQRLSFRFLVAAMVIAGGVGLAPSPALAQDSPKVLSPGGFAAIDWLLAGWDRDLFEVWTEHGDVGKLKGPVAKYLDWPNVSAIIVLYNAWHLLATNEDKRVQHVAENLSRAAFGDRFQGTGNGAAYILLLEYRNSDRRVVVGFKQGVFLIEGADGIGAVDIRGAR